MTPQARRRAVMRSASDVPEFGAAPDPLPRRPAENTCQACRWAQENARPGSFKCRRWPPVVHQARPGEALFPIVEGNDWCGEWQQ